MQVQQRSYTSGKYFRPRPLVKERPESHLLLVATSWGPAESAELATTSFVEQFELLEKEDLTTPFEIYPTLSPVANRLRTSTLIANQAVYKAENLKVWRTSVEFLALHFHLGVLSWCHIGSPHLFLVSQKRIHPLAYSLDWGQQTEGNGPLFSQGLGLESNVPMNVGSVRIKKDTSLIMLARGHFDAKPDLAQAEFDSLFRNLVEDDAESPFWLGQIVF